MRTSIVLSILASALSAFTLAVDQPDPNFHIYLAFGQSNMEGQGPAEVQDRLVDDRFKLITTTSDHCMGRELGQWYPAIPPIVNCYGSVGPLDWFGRTLTEKLPEVTVGVVPVAIAGCDIQLFEEANYQTYEQPDWMVGRVESYGGNPYRRLVDIAKEAQKSGVIKGILLHQGETNNGQLDWPDRVKAIYDDLLKELDLKAEDVPLLAGEVVSTEKNGLCGAHNDIIHMLPEVIPTSYVIYASDLDQQGDDLHFTSAAYRTLGERYAEKMLEILNGTPEEEEPTQEEEEPTQEEEEPTPDDEEPTPDDEECTEIVYEEVDCDENGNEIPPVSEEPTEEECTEIVYEEVDCDENGNEIPPVTEEPTEEECTETVYEDVDCDEDGNEITDAPEKTEDVNEPEETCWSEPLGYPCCKKENPHVYARDEDGVWGVENHNWCGITVKGCWSEKLGYPCCEKENPKIYYKDANGIWGVEHGNWCGIIA